MARDLKGVAVIFDLDGTLVDTAADLAASMNHALALAGLAPVDAGDVRHLVGRGAKRMLARGFEIAAGRAPRDEELESGLTAFLDYYAAHIAAHSRPFDGAIEVVERLRGRGAGLAICTNKREGLTRRLLDALGLAPLFGAIVGADTAGAPKPDPAPARLCLERTGAARAVFIGDSDTDILAARAVGAPCLIAEFGYGPLALREEADAVFTHYRQLERLIDEALTP